MMRSLTEPPLHEEPLSPIRSGRRGVFPHASFVLSVAICFLLLGATTPLHASDSLTFEGLVRTINTGGITLSSPAALAIDRSGNIFIADTINSRIVQVNAQGAASVLMINGLSPASLSSPSGIVADGAGNLYIADTGNSRVVKVNSSGVGSVISTGSVGLSLPQGIALDQSGNIFIADAESSQIVEVTSGGSAAALTINVSSGPASLSSPRGLAVDASGKLYIADSNNNRIVTVASGSTTGVVLSAGGLVPGLSGPSSIAVDRVGNVYVADTGHNRITELDAAGNGAILLNTTYLQDTTLNGPLGVAVDVFCAVYIADTQASRVLTVYPYLNGDPETLPAYTSSLNQSTIGFGHIVFGSSTPTSQILTFSVGSPVSTLGGVKVFTSGTQGLDFQMVSGASTNCSSSSTSGSVCTVEVSFLPTAPGLRSGALVLYDPDLNPILTLSLYGFSDAPVAALAPNPGTTVNTGSVATNYPYQLALDGAGNMYVANYVQDGASPKVVKIPAGGGSGSIVSVTGISPGLGTSLRGVALDGAGNLFIADYYQNRIVVVTPGGVASILSIRSLSPALGEPTELAFDAAGNLYIGDYAANGRPYSRVVRVSSLKVLGSTSTGIGTVINTGSYTFSSSTITGVAVGPDGTVYIAARTSNSSHVVQVTAAGVTSLLSPAGLPASAPQNFSNPQGVFVDGMGNLYVEDSGNSRIVRITTGGIASAISVSGLASPSSLAQGYGLTVDAFGNFYIPDWNNSRIVFANVSGAALSFLPTKQGFTSTDSPRPAPVTNLGNLPLIFSADPAYTPDFSNGTDPNPCTAPTSLSAGTSCNVSVQFTPQSIGSLSAGITVTNNTLNVAGSTQQVSVSGLATNPGDVTGTSVTISPTFLANGQAATITATVSDVTHTATTPTGNVTFVDTVASTAVTLNNGSSVALSGGRATLTNVVLSGIGTHTITASYGGVTATYVTSSGSTTATLSKAPVTLVGPLTQPVQVIYAQTGSAAVTATVPYTTIAVPTGTLSYSILDSPNVSAASGSLPLTAGSGNAAASVPIPSTLAVGNYSISVTYAGDSNYQASTTATTIPVQVLQPQFAITVPPSGNSSATVTAGGTAAYTLSFAPTNVTNYPSAVTFTVTGLPPGATGTVSPNPLPAGSPVNTPVVLTIHLPSQTALHRNSRYHPGLAIVMAGMLLLPLNGKVRRAARKGGLHALLLVLMLLGIGATTAGLAGCGATGSGYIGRNPANYTVTITGTSGSVSHSTSVTITVQ